MHRKWLRDLLAGLTVALVSLPASLAFGVASGAGAAAGIYSAIVGGALAGIFGGAPLQISTPTAVGAVIFAEVGSRHGLEVTFLAAILGGLFQILFGLLRLGNLIRYLPYSVIAGYTSGLAILISWQQLRLIGKSPASLAMAGATVLLLFGLRRISRVLPEALVGVLLMTAATALLDLPVPLIGEIPAVLPTPHLPPVTLPDLRAMIGPGLTVALLGSITTLLSAIVADGMVPGRRHDSSRELLGQGIANALCPLFGAMPCAGSLTRTAVNIKSGASTRLAGLVNCAVLLLIVLALGPWVSHIPLPALSGVLFKICLDIAGPEEVRTLLHLPRPELAVALLTTGAMVFADLLVAVGLGLLLSAALFIRRASHLEITSHPLEEEQVGDLQEYPRAIAVYDLEGPLFFGAAVPFAQAIEESGQVEILILRMKRVPFLDASGAAALRALSRRLRREKRHLLISGLNPEGQRILQAMGITEEIGPDHFFDHLFQAVAFAKAHIAASRFHLGRIRQGKAAA